jgi:uncharacterized protein (DUF433 family)
MTVHAETNERVTVNSKVMLGKPTIRGIRITVEQGLTALAGGLSVQEFLDDYPELEEADVTAALLYATGLVREEQVYAFNA